MTSPKLRNEFRRNVVLVAIQSLWTVQKQTHFLSPKPLFVNTLKVSVRTVGRQLTKRGKGENKQVQGC